jgi:hypothetical protein
LSEATRIRSTIIWQGALHGLDATSWGNGSSKVYE